MDGSRRRMERSMKAVVGAFIGLLGLALIPPALADASPPPDYAAIIAAPDRTDVDRKNDERRQAVKLLAFTGVLPGWKVIDMAAGTGYSTELMARGAAPGGAVDRARMNRAMFDALKRGGHLVAADYAALPGAPISTGK